MYVFVCVCVYGINVYACVCAFCVCMCMCRKPKKTNPAMKQSHFRAGKQCKHTQSFQFFFALDQCYLSPLTQISKTLLFLIDNNLYGGKLNVALCLEFYVWYRCQAIFDQTINDDVCLSMPYWFEPRGQRALYYYYYQQASILSTKAERNGIFYKQPQIMFE